MRALVAAPNNPAKIELRDVAEPTPTANEAVVAVKAVSLNRGESNRAMSESDGWRPGWDISGVVLHAAADGTGPKEGTRVVGLVGGGGWAEQVAVHTNSLAPIPDSVSFATASTLPVAGLTALRMLRMGGLLVGKRVLVTGAAGGVGRFAVQLAAHAGAHVTAVVGTPERGDGLRELGADDIITEFAAQGDQFDLILESAGGASLAAAFARVAAWGTIVTFGNSSGEDTHFNIRSFYGRMPHLSGFTLFSTASTPFSRDLAHLAHLVAEGHLDPQVSLERNWADAADAIAALRGRQVVGKAVLTLD